MNNLHRIFIAINLPDNLRNRLAAIEDRYPELPARWTRRENLHITLNFLGNCDDQEICDIIKLVGEAAQRHDPFDITLQKICYGPPKKMPPRMVWACGEKSEDLGSLQRDLENTLHEFAGADSDSGNCGFAPHVTLARINQSGLRTMDTGDLPVIEESIGRTFLVESVEVMESELKRGGPDYAVLESLKLGE